MKRKGKWKVYRGSEVTKELVTEDEEKGKMKGLQRDWSNKEWKSEREIKRKEE